MKTISVSSRFFLLIASLCLAFCLALFLLKDAVSLCFVLPLCAAAFVGAKSTPQWFLKLFFLFLPLLGFLNIVLSLPILPVLLPIFYAGFIGRHFRLGAAEKFSVPMPVLLYVSGLLLSVVVAALTLSDSFPKANALAWTGFYFALFMSGVTLMLWIVQEHVDFDALVRWAIFGMLGAAVVGILQFSGFTSLAGFSTFLYRGFYQYNATFRDPNALGIFCALLIPLWVALSIEGRLGRFLGWSGVCLLLLLVMSGVRSAYLILIVTGILFAVRAYASNNARLKKALFALSCLIVLFVGYQITFRPYSRFAIMVRDAKKLDSASALAGEFIGNRRVLWQSGWVTFKHNPLFGTGLGNYLIKMPSYAKELPHVINDNSGNMYLHVAAEQGVLGFLIFLFLIGSLFAEFLQCGLRSAPLLNVAAASALAGLCVAFFFGAHLLGFETNILFWLLAAITYEHNQRNKTRT